MALTRDGSSLLPSLFLYLNDSLLIKALDILPSSFWAMKINKEINYPFPYNPKIEYKSLWAAWAQGKILWETLVGSLDYGEKTLTIFKKYFEERPGPLDYTHYLQGMIRAGNSSLVLFFMKKLKEGEDCDLRVLYGEAWDSQEEDLLIYLNSLNEYLDYADDAKLEILLKAKLYKYFRLTFELVDEDNLEYFCEFRAIASATDREQLRFLLTFPVFKENYEIVLNRIYRKAIQDDNFDLVDYFTALYDAEHPNSLLDKETRRAMNRKLDTRSRLFEYFFSKPNFEEYIDLFIIFSNNLSHWYDLSEMRRYIEEKGLLEEYALRDRSLLLRETLRLELHTQEHQEAFAFFARLPHDLEAVKDEVYSALSNKFGKNAKIIFKYLPYRVKDLSIRQQKDLLRRLLNDKNGYVTFEVVDYLQFPLKILQAEIGNLTVPKKAKNYKLIIPLLEKIKNLKDPNWGSIIFSLARDASNSEDRQRLDALKKRTILPRRK